MSAWLQNRNSVLSTFNAVNINYSTMKGSTVAMNSTMISLGSSTNQNYINLAQGNFSSSTSWISTLNTASTIKFVTMSGNAQTQLAVSQVSTISSLYYTSTLGTSWVTLSGATGLPSATQTNYSAGAVSGDGRVVAVATNGGYLYTSNNSGASFTNTNPNTPFIYLPFETIPVNGAIGGTTLTVTGSPALVTGIVGSKAVNLVNTAGGVATQYIRGTWSGATNFTVSLWFNIQTVGNHTLFITSPNNLVIQLSSNGILQYYSSTGINILTSSPITTNTWYNVTAIYQASGVCSLYINNALIGQGTSAGAYSNITAFNLGCYDNTNGALNGYIDDFKIYNTAITFTPMVPANWNNVALSNSGQYMLATVANGGLFMSSNSGSTWSQVTSELLAANWSSLAISATGQYMLAYSAPVVVQPQLAGLASSTWQVNGVTWTASASLFTPGYNPYNAFSSGSVTTWVTPGGYSSIGTYTGSFSTYVNGQGAVAGEWLQIQSSVPIQMYSYTMNSNTPQQYPNGLTIAGSNDGVNWYLLQSVTMSGNPTGSTNFTTSTSYIIVNQIGAQTMITTGGSSTFTCTTSAYSANSYIYFRLIAPAVFGNYTTVAIFQWFINFTAGGQAYSTNFGSTWQNGYALGANAVVPQLTNLASSTWMVNGVNWTASASTTLDARYAPYLAFNNSYTSIYGWACITGLYSTTYQGSVTTTVIGIGATAGEWLQLQSSVPLQMYSYNVQVLYSTNAVKSYVIAGSNDGTTWYAIQSATLAQNPYTAHFQESSSYLLANYTGTQTIVAGSSTIVTTTSYSTSANTYTYFRVIGTLLFSGGEYFETSEWNINFNATPSLSLSGSGQYALGVFRPTTISPQQTGLTSTTATVSYAMNGVNWTVSGSSYLGEYYPYKAFNNKNGDAWLCDNVIQRYNGAGVVNANAATTSVTGVGTVAGEYLQVQSSVPIVMYSFALGLGVNPSPGNAPKTYYIIGSNDGTNWYTLQTGTTNITTLAGSSGYIIINQTGTQLLSGTSSGNIVTVAATTATNPYMYFRLIGTSIINGGGSTYMEIGEWYINFTIPSNTSIYNIVSNYLGGFSTGTYTSGSIPGFIVASATSMTGQYMALVTNNTSGNNVYYSTNYGSTFTGLTIGSTPMTTCAISADGSYITVSNGTTVYQLNNNSNGFSLALGNSAGQQNQGQNAIAIGNYAGQINQSANSIVLNATGSVINPVMQGFYVAPIAQYTASSSSLSLLAYGTDNQVVQSGIVMNSSGNVAINYNVNSPNCKLVIEQGFNNNSNGLFISNTNYGSMQGLNISMVNNGLGNFYSYASIQGYTSGVAALVPLCLQPTGGFVGIGTTNPVGLLHIYGSTSTYTSGTLTVVNTNTIPAVSCAIIAPNMSLTGASGNLFAIGQATSQYNSIVMGWFSVGAGSTSNYLNINGYSNITAGGLNITAGGNVGIGITNPFSLLHVNGSSTFGNANGTSNYENNIGIITAPSSNGQIVGSTSTSLYGTRLQIFGGRLTTTVWNNSNYGGDIVLAAGDMIDSGNNGTVGGMYYGGNILIRSGRVAVDNGGGNSQGISGGSIYFQVGQASRANPSALGSYNNAMMISSNGNVGIGTNNPGGQLSLYSTTSVRDTCIIIKSVQPGIKFDGTLAGGGGKMWNIWEGYAAEGGNAGALITYNETNSVFVFILYPNGNATLGGTLTQNSDITLKKNIEPVANGLSIISTINPVLYHFKTQSDSEYKHYGMIAQDVQKVLPNLVGESNDVLTLNYIEFVPILISAVKEQNAIIKSQQAQIDSLLTWAKTQGFQ